MLGAGLAADDAEEDLFEGEGLAACVVVGWIAGFDAGAELFEGAVGDEAAAVDDRDVSAEALDDFEDVRGEEDGGAARDHALKHGFERAGGDGVDAFEGFVEEEDFGAVDNGSGESEFFLHAVGEVGDELFGFVGERHELEQLLGAGGGGGGIEAVHAADEVEVLGCGKTAEEGEAFGDDADLAFDFNGIGEGVEAEDPDAAGGGGEKAGEHLDGGGFAGAVGAEEAEELAGRDGEVDVLNGSKVAKAASEAGGGDGRDHVGEAYLSGNCGRRESCVSQGKNEENCGGKLKKSVIVSGPESNSEVVAGLIYSKTAAKFLWSLCIVWFGQDSMLDERALQNGFG